MAIFKYTNESFLHFKGSRVTIFDYDVYSYAYVKGFLRFRMFDRGAVIKDLSLHNKTLCDLRKKGYRFKHWYLRFIKL